MHSLYVQLLEGFSSPHSLLQMISCLKWKQVSRRMVG